MRVAVPMMFAGRMTTLNRWFDSLSWPEAEGDRELATMRALTARLSGQGRDEVERWLRVAEDGPDYGPLANGITLISSAVAMVSSTYLSRGIADAERAARLVLENEPAGRAGDTPASYRWDRPSSSPVAPKRREHRSRRPDALGARRRATSVLALAYLSLIELSTEMPSTSNASHGTPSRSPRRSGTLRAPPPPPPPRPRMCPDARGRSSCSDRAPRTRRGARRRGRTVLLARACRLHLAMARHRVETRTAPTTHSHLPVKNWLSFRTSGCSGSSYERRTTRSIARDTRGSRGGAQRRGATSTRPPPGGPLESARRRARALALAEHGQDASSKHLPEARRNDARGDDRARRREIGILDLAATDAHSDE